MLPLDNYIPPVDANSTPFLPHDFPPSPWSRSPSPIADIYYSSHHADSVSITLSGSFRPLGQVTEPQVVNELTMIVSTTPPLSQSSTGSFRPPPPLPIPSACRCLPSPSTPSTSSVPAQAEPASPLPTTRHTHQVLYFPPSTSIPPSPSSKSPSPSIPARPGLSTVIHVSGHALALAGALSSQPILDINHLNNNIPTSKPNCTPSTRAYILAFLMDTLPRQLYLYMLLRLPYLDSVLLEGDEDI
ncbi:hypothetical protein BDZ97DRAFT_310103 [Flammula alnicola]|nr:hypothetical protein BDZ97DRAFT_310103 [Flammula alnicola]